MNPTEMPVCLHDYELLSEIGTEGPAIIYRARQKSLDRPVTLHLVQLADLGDAAEGDRYMRAARAAARLDHPSIVRVFDLGSDDDFAFVATGLVEGETLTQHCAGKPLPPKQAAELLSRLATAIASAHQRGVVHRGLDPQQVRLDAAGQPRIVGFGTLRSFVSGATLTSSSAAISPYTPPESVEGSPANHPSVDVYGLGGLMYFILTGKPPFVAASVPDLVSAIAAKAPSLPSRQQSRIPKELDAICLKCLAKKPGDRYADAAEVAETLRRWLKPGAQVTTADPLVETLVPHDASTRNLGKSTVRPQRRGLLIGVSLAAIVLLGIGAWGILRRPPAGEPKQDAASIAAEGTLDSRLSSEVVARAGEAINHAAAVPLHGDFNMVRAVDRWKAARVQVERAERTAISPDDRRTVESLRATVEFGITFCQGILGVERRLVESLPEDGWRADDGAAAQSLQEVFLASGWDVRSMSPTETRAKLDGLPFELQSSVKHWLTRWEICAAAAKRPEVATLQAIASSLDDSSWYQLFLATRTETDPGQLLRLAASVPSKLRMSDRTLVLESLAARDLIGKPEAQAFIDSSREVSGMDVEKFWFHWRAAQNAQSRAGSTIDAADALVIALELAARVSPHVGKVHARWEAAKASSPSVIERHVAEWVLAKGGYVQVWFPKVEEWAHVPVYKIGELPKGNFHLSGLSMRNCDIRDSDLEQITALPHLKRIYLDGTNVTDEGVRSWIGAFKSLAVLSLERTSASNEVLLGLSNVERVYARKTRITPEGIDQAVTRYPTLHVIHDGSQDAVQPAVSTANAIGSALEFGPRCHVKSKIRISSEQPFTIEARMRYTTSLSFSAPWTVGLISESRPSTPEAVYAVAIQVSELEQASLWALGPMRGMSNARSSPLRKEIVPDRPLHLAGVSDKTHLRTFVDGHLVGETPIARYEFDGLHDLLIGISGVVTYPQFEKYDCSLHGAIDEVRVSSVARYVADFTPTRRHEPDEHTIALYHFDEGEGDEVRDSSGNNYHGTITGARWISQQNFEQ